MSDFNPLCLITGTLSGCAAYCFLRAASHMRQARRLARELEARTAALQRVLALLGDQDGERERGVVEVRRG